MFVTVPTLTLLGYLPFLLPFLSLLLLLSPVLPPQLPSILLYRVTASWLQSQQIYSL
jgi:hypothetical protein